MPTSSGFAQDVLRCTCGGRRSAVPLVHHKLHAVVDARGQISVHAQLADTSAAMSGIRWAVHACDRTIALTGRKHYAFSCVVEVVDNGE